MKKRGIKKGKRFLYLALMFTAVFTVLIGRLVYLVAFNGVEYKVTALSQWIKEIDIASKRGTVLDRNGAELAVSLKVFRVDADLKVLKKYWKGKSIPEGEAVGNLSSILAINKEQLQKVLESVDAKGSPLQFVSLKRRVNKEAVDAIKALKYYGIIISEDAMRMYTNDSFLSHVIGHTNGEGRGVTGIELWYNDELKGINGKKVVETDKTNNELPYSEPVVIQPIQGKNITLTIDEKIQELAERVAKETQRENKAKSVSITIMDPKNGEVLAMVNTPSYNPNSPEQGGKSDKEIQELWRNSAVSNIFEPGSIFKVVTAAAALQNNSVSSNDTFICKGSILVGDQVIRCDEPGGHGVQTLSDIIKNSCNVGFVQLGQKIGKEKLANYIKEVGFGQKTGIDLPGESAGLIKPLKDIGTVELATMSYGQGIAVTQLQFLAAFNAVANGGTWIQPHVMKEISHKVNGEIKIDKQFESYGEKDILDKEKAEELRGYLEKVVSEGTSTATYMPGYHIAGKTGTATKVDPENGGYETGKYISSFAGMVPAKDPKVTVLITIVEPDSRKYYASQTAVPAAKKLFSELVTLINIPPDSIN